MLRKLFIIIVILWSAGLNAHAQLRAERKALRVFCHRILRHVNTDYFYPADSVHRVYYDGTVASYTLGDRWLLPVWYKDVWGFQRAHFVMRRGMPTISFRSRERLRILRHERKLAIKHDFDSATYFGNDMTHDLRQRDSLGTERLRVLAPLQRVSSSAYQRLALYDCGAYNYLTVHRAIVGRRYVLVGLVVACEARCSGWDNVDVAVLLHRRSLRLADWWYIIKKPNLR